VSPEKRRKRAKIVKRKANFKRAADKRGAAKGLRQAKNMPRDND